jgi:hypothetical protein
LQPRLWKRGKEVVKVNYGRASKVESNASRETKESGAKVTKESRKYKG